MKTPRPVAGYSQDCDSVCSALGRTCNAQACASSPGCREWEGLATRNWECVPPSGPSKFSGHVSDQTVWTCSKHENCKLWFLTSSLFQGFFFSPKPFRMFRTISGTKAKFSGTDHNFSGTARLLIVSEIVWLFVWKLPWSQPKYSHRQLILPTPGMVPNSFWSARHDLLIKILTTPIVAPISSVEWLKKKTWHKDCCCMSYIFPVKLKQWRLETWDLCYTWVPESFFGPQRACRENLHEMWE